MDLVLWIAAGLLAAVALVGGISKTFVPKDRLERLARMSDEEVIAGAFPFVFALMAD